MLKRRGIERVRPLAGGLEGWIDDGFPTEELPRQDHPDVCADDSSAAASD